MDFTVASRKLSAAARRRAAAVTIGSVYELEYAASLVPDLLLSSFDAVKIQQKFSAVLVNPTAAVIRICHSNDSKGFSVVCDETGPTREEAFLSSGSMVCALAGYS